MIMKKLAILAMIALIGAYCTKPTPKPVNEIADNLSEIENQALYVDAVEAVQGEINYQLAYGCFRKLGSRRLQAAVDSVTSYVYRELFNNNKNILNELTTKAVTYESQNQDSMAIGRIMGWLGQDGTFQRKAFENKIDTLLSVGQKFYRLYATDGCSYIVEIRYNGDKSIVSVNKESKRKR